MKYLFLIPIVLSASFLSSAVFADDKCYVQSNVPYSWNGGCVNGKAHGNGILKHYAKANQKLLGTYTGQLNQGLLNGHGTYTYANGEQYVGQFQSAKRNGQGTYTHANGDQYVGQWKNENRHGQGTFTYADGRVLRGRWVNGKHVK